MTGSSRLDTFRQSGESLAGRYFHLSLNPISVKELDEMESPYEAVEQAGDRPEYRRPIEV